MAEHTKRLCLFFLHLTPVPDAGEQQDGTGRTESETVAGIVRQTPIKDAAHFYVHSSHLCPGEMERKVPALTISAQAFDRSVIHAFMHLLQTNASPFPAAGFFFKLLFKILAYSPLIISSTNADLPLYWRYRAQSSVPA